MNKEEFNKKYPPIFWLDELIKRNEDLYKSGLLLIEEKKEIYIQRSTQPHNKRMRALRQIEIIEELNNNSWNTFFIEPSTEWITNELLEAFERLSLPVFINVYHEQIK